MRKSQKHGEGGGGKSWEEPGLVRGGVCELLDCLLVHLFGTRVPEPFLPPASGLFSAGGKEGALTEGEDRQGPRKAQEEQGHAHHCGSLAFAALVWRGWVVLD